MKIFLEGACNARDLGGMETSLGRVKKGRLVRSGELSRLTQADIATLQTLPLTRIIDLRTEAEKQLSPDVEMVGVQRESVHIIRATTFGITYEKSSGAEIAQMLKAGYERMAQRNETYAQHMELLYRRFVQDDFARCGYGKFLKLLAHNPLSGATLWHCTAGKDRVGTCTALLLHCLGASREQIFADYILTNEQSQESRNSVLNKVRAFVSETDLAIVEKMLLADNDYLNGFYAEIENNFGNVENFLVQCGVTSQDIEQLQNNYLE